ncbi:MAG: hypothetical protein LBH97_01445 [Treponema sp.]|jgi:hypothetical protein|nr:hypothetical protein [Treponema sp.]
MKSNKINVLCFFLILAGTLSVFALDVESEAPYYSGGLVADALNLSIKNAFDDALGQLDSMIGGINSKPEDFIRSWGNSAIFASHGATQRAYGGYKLLSITAGSMLGLQLPIDPLTLKYGSGSLDELGAIIEKLNNEGDIELSFSPQLINVQFGLNTSKFLLNNLYLGIRFGTIKLDNLIDGFSFNSFTLGLTANYQLLEPKSAAKLLVWRGLNVGAGFVYHNTTLGYTYILDTIEENLDLTSDSTMNVLGSPVLKIDPKLFLDMKINTVTIPLEITTAVQLLSLNLALGVGVDLGFGSSNLKIGLDGDITIDGLNENHVTREKDGYVSVSAGGEMTPRFFNFKFMTGIGFIIGPVIVDIPITFYVGNGYNIGFTFGVVL